MMAFTPVDICFLILMLVFAVLALLKGFIKEIFGKVSVIGGLACSIVFSPRLTPYVENALHNKIVSVVLSFLLVFVAVFLVICIVQRVFEKIFSGEIMRGLDRVLGFLLGAAEGLVVVLFLMVVVTIQHGLTQNPSQRGVCFSLYFHQLSILLPTISRE